MGEKKLNYGLLNALIAVIIAYIALITMDYWWNFITKIITIVSPFAIAFAIAYALYPLVKLLKSKGVSNNLAVTMIVTVILFIIVGLIWMTVPLVYEQLIQLSAMVGKVITEISTKFEVNLGDFQTTINESLNTIIKSLGQYVSDGTVDFVGKSLDFLTKAIIIAIVSVYFLGDMEKIRGTIKNLLTKRKKKSKLYAFTRQADKELSQYLYGLMIFMVIQFIEYSLVFRIVNHPNWLLLGILASLTTIIPYFGGIITNIIAIILATVVSPTLTVATVIIILIFPNIDGYIISPRIYGKTNNINPLLSIFAVFAGGVLFGFVGIVISLPLYIIIRCLYNFYKEDIVDKIEDIKDGK